MKKVVYLKIIALMVAVGICFSAFANLLFFLVYGYNPERTLFVFVSVPILFLLFGIFTPFALKKNKK